MDYLGQLRDLFVGEHHIRRRVTIIFVGSFRLIALSPSLLRLSCRGPSLKPLVESYALKSRKLWGFYKFEGIKNEISPLFQ